MFTEMASTVGEVLVSNGIKILGDAVGTTTEAGLKKVSKMVKDSTGIDLFNDEKILNNNLSEEQIATLQKLENVKAKELYTLAIQYAKIVTEDTQNARQMQETMIINGSWLQQNFIYLFAIFWSTFAAVYIFKITFTDIPPESQRFADTILGFILGTVIASILQFFFGSSISSPAMSATTKAVKK